MFQTKNGSRLILMAMILALMGISALADAMPDYYPRDYSKIIEASHTDISFIALLFFISLPSFLRVYFAVTMNALLKVYYPRHSLSSRGL